MAKSKSGILVDTVEASLKGSTGAGDQVFIARTWPLSLSALPAIMVDPIYRERKQSLGRNAPQFTTITTIQVRGRVTSPAGPDDAGALACAEGLETLKNQIERTVINAAPIMSQIQQFTEIDIEFLLNSEGKQNIGELQMSMSMEFYEGPDDFAPIDADELERVTVYTDLINVASPTNTFNDTPFPDGNVPAPRDHGPDGRVEGGGLLIDTTV